MTKAYKPNPAKLAKLRELATDPNFAEFKDLLDSRISVQLEGILTTEGRVEWRRGYAKGLTDARNLLQSFLASQDGKDAREDRSRRAERKRNDGRRLSTFGTQWHTSL